MLVTLEVELEPEPAAQIADGSVGPSPAELDVARDVDAEVRRDYPLRIGRRSRPGDGQHNEKKATPNSHQWFSYGHGSASCSIAHGGKNAASKSLN